MKLISVSLRASLAYCFLLFFPGIAAGVENVTNTCLDIEGTTFDLHSQSCYLLVGAVCIIGQPYSCIPNAVCLKSSTTQSFCTCIGELVPNEHRFCFEALDSSCDTELDLCDPIQHLHCSAVSETCICGQNSFFHSNTCVLKVHSECGLSKERCGPNSDCVLDAESQSFTCECVKDFAGNDEGQCLVPHGRPCSTNGTLECMDSFICDDQVGLCTCPSHTWYDESTDVCFVKANENCANSIIECTPHSKCSIRSGKCICQAPLTPNKYGQCFLTQLQDCENDYECDESVGLVCQHSNCECPYGMWFEDGRCRLVAGRPCSLPGQCTANSKCVQVGGQWMCDCVNGTRPNSNHLCYLEHGNKCELDEQCDPTHFLVCRDSQCTCPAGMKYFEGGCRIMAESPCLRPSPVCIPNAHCVNKSCRCETGYEMADCVRSFGYSCDLNTTCTRKTECIGNRCLCSAGHTYFPESIHGCLPGLNQTCLSDMSCSPTLLCNPMDNICQCPHPHQVYNPSNETKCVSLVGGHCSSLVGEELLECVSNADCTQLNENDRYGICVCKGNYSVSVSDTCITKSGAGKLSFSFNPHSIVVTTTTLLVYTSLNFS